MSDVAPVETKPKTIGLRALLAEHGCTIISSSTSGGTDDGKRRSIGDKTLVAPDLAELGAALKAIPCVKLDYDEWIATLHALKAACAGDEGFYLDHILPWCLAYPDNSEEICREKWESIADSTVGAEVIFGKARQNGYDDAERLFADEPPAAIKTPSATAGTVPQVRSFDWYRTQDFPAEEWLVEGLIPAGSVMFAMGRPKVGKGLLAMQLGLTVAAGGKFLNAYQCTQSEVLHITFEEDDRMIAERIASLADCYKGLPVNFATEWPRIGKGGIEALDDYATRNPKCRFYIIDPFAVIREAQRAHGSAYDLDYAAVRPLFEWAKRRGVAIFCVHHTRKAESPNDWQDAANGSTGLIGAVDGTLLLTGQRNGSTGRLRITGRFKMHTDDIALTKDSDGRWFATGSTDARRATVRESVFEAIRAGCSTPADIAKHIGRKANHVWNELAKMRADGVIMQLGHGQWGLPRTVEDLFV